MVLLKNYSHILELDIPTFIAWLENMRVFILWDSGSFLTVFFLLNHMISKNFIDNTYNDDTLLHFTKKQ